MFTSMMRKALLADDAKLSLDFTSGVLPSGVNFSRAANTATRINSSGLVEPMSADQPRFDHDPTTGSPRGLLIEASATNLASYSEDFSNAAWTKNGTNGSMTLTGTAPDNNATSRLLEENTTSYAKHSLERSINISAGIHTLSVWLKEPSANSRRYAHIQLADGQATAARYTIVADLQTGTITASGANNGTAGAPTGTGHRITPYANGWYRVTISMNHVASPSYPTIMLGDSASLSGGFNQPFYSATTPYKGLLVWGAQFETGSGASSYIPTGASQATRNPDICTVSGAAFSSWYNASEGTFFADFRRRRTDNTASVLSANNNSTAEVIELAADTAAKFNIVDNGSTQVASFVAPFLANTDTKLAGAFKLNDCQMASNGASSNVDSTATIPTVDRLYIGRDAGAVPVYLDGHVRSVKFYDFRKDQTKLGEMTT